MISEAIDSIDGVDFMPIINPVKYGQEYFDRFAAMGKTPFGIALNSLRVGLIARYLILDEHLVDIGIGDGAFMRARGGRTDGYDINPIARELLEKSGSFYDVRLNSIESASFFDSLEHIENHLDILRKIKHYCFVSIPVFRDRAHILRSKHFRPTEHYWYFTRAGLIAWFWKAGFMCLEMNEAETMLGREDIGTFVFGRHTRWT